MFKDSEFRELSATQLRPRVDPMSVSVPVTCVVRTLDPVLADSVRFWGFLRVGLEVAAEVTPEKRRGVGNSISKHSSFKA